MATSLNVIRTLTTRAKLEGGQEMQSGLKGISAAHDDVARSSERSEKATRSLEEANRRMQQQISSQMQVIAQMKAANDNLAASTNAANDNYQSFGKTLVSQAADFVSTVSHLKLLGAAAYALSPAFRSFTNSAVTAGLGQLASTLPTVASATTKVVGALSPALQFFTRLSIPVGIAVAAFTALNAVWTTGADLLDKYANRQRDLFGSSEDAANLAKLTKFQDAVPLEVINRAQELGSRLQDAKDKLAEFAKVQLDLNDPALKLQAAWVVIVELIAKAVGLLPSLGEGMTSLAQKFGNLPFWKMLSTGGDQSDIVARINAQNGPSTQQTQETQEAARARGITLLSQAMKDGTSFAERFSNAISDLANPKKDEEVKVLTGEFERLSESMSRSIAATEADSQTVGKSAGDVARLRAEFRLLEAAQQDILKNGGSLEQYSDRIKEIADRAGAAAAALAKAQVASQIKFETATIGLSNEDVRIAQQLRLVFDDVPTALASAEASQLRFNSRIRDAQELTGDFVNTFVSGMLQGQGAVESLGHSLQSLGASLTQMATQSLGKQLIGSVGVGGAAGTGITGLLGQLLPSLGSMAGPAGAGVGLAAGIGISLLGKLFGGSDDKAQQEQAAAAARAAEELKRAQEAWAGMTNQLKEFNATAAGLAQGDLAKSITGLTDTAATLMKAANAAHDFAGEVAIGQTAIAGVGRLLNEFARDLPGLISGFGQSGPTAEAKQSIKNLMDQFESLNDSIHEFASRTLSDQTEAYQKLNAAARDALVNTLELPDTLSDIAQKLAELQAKAEVLPDALIQLGVSAEDAANIISTKLNVAIDKLRSSFLDDLTRQVNELAGGEWINQASDLAAKVAQMRADAAALGIQTSLITEFYVRSAQKIVDENQLTGSSFDALQAQLGLAGTSLHAFNAAVEETAKVVVRSMAEIQQAIQSNQDRLFTALHASGSIQDQLALLDLKFQREREAEIAAGGQALVSLVAAQEQEKLNLINDYNAQQLQAQLDAQQKAADAAQQAADAALKAQQQAAEEQARIIDEARKFLTGALQNIANWIQHFLAGSASPLSPAARLSSAQSSFSTQFSSALGGNRDALSGITQNAQDVIDAAKAYYGSSVAGQTIINGIISQLQSLPAQVSAEQFIVDGLTTPINTVASTVTTATANQTSTLTGLFSTLQAAVSSGDANAVALALSPLFNTLDTNVNGLLDFSEFSSGLHNMASDSALATMFKTLDTDNSGSLSKLELIRGATDYLPVIRTDTSGTKTSVDDTKASVDSGNSLQNTANSILASVNTSTLFLSSMANDTSIIRDSVGPAGALSYLSSINVYLSNLPAINGYLSTIASWAPGSNHAMGGYITGPGTGTSDSVLSWLSNGEGVIKASVMSSLGGRPAIDAINAGRFPVVPGMVANDNSEVVGELRAVRAELAAVRAELAANTRITAGGAGAIVNSVEKVAEHAKTSAKAARRAA